MLRIHRIKPYLRQFPLISCYALTTLVVAVWIRSYFASDVIRWFDFSESAGGDTMIHQSCMIVTGMGGLNFSSIYDRTSAPGLRNLLQQMRSAFAQTPPSRFASRQPAHYPMRAATDDSEWTSLGFGWFFVPETSDDGATYRRRMSITVPLWSIFAATMAYPFGLYVAGVVRRQREERLALGLCPRCGSAFKDGSERCPGCDRPVPAALVRHA